MKRKKGNIFAWPKFNDRFPAAIAGRFEVAIFFFFSIIIIIIIIISRKRKRERNKSSAKSRKKEETAWFVSFCFFGQRFVRPIRFDREKPKTENPKKTNEPVRNNGTNRETIKRTVQFFSFFNLSLVFFFLSFFGSFRNDGGGRVHTLGNGRAHTHTHTHTHTLGVCNLHTYTHTHLWLRDGDKRRKTIGD